jgi:hypothetical protein
MYVGVYVKCLLFIYLFIYLFIFGFPLQQCLPETARMLRYTYIVCLVIKQKGMCLLCGTSDIFKRNLG